MNLLRLVAAVTILAGCGILDSSSRDSSPLSFSIMGGSYFDPPEVHHIALIVQTRTQYPCMNYQLESTLGIARNSLRVDVSGRVLKPDICLTALGPAQYRAALPLDDGTYSLEFRRGGLTDRYTVFVTTSAIEIATLESHFTHPAADRFPRD